MRRIKKIVPRSPIIYLCADDIGTKRKVHRFFKCFPDFRQTYGYKTYS